MPTKFMLTIEKLFILILVYHIVYNRVISFKLLLLFFFARLVSVRCQFITFHCRVIRIVKGNLYFRILNVINEEEEDDEGKKHNMHNIRKEKR